MSEALLVLWLGLIGADRIDLLAGAGGFVLTPFLLLTPLVLLVESFRVVGNRGVFWLPRDAPLYTLVVTLLVSVVLLSVFFSYELEMAAKRSVLLIFQVYATLLVAVALAGRAGLGSVLVRGAYLGLALGVVFNVAQLGYFVSGMNSSLGSPESVVNLVPHTYAGIIPRLSGQVFDQNRGGLLLLCYVFILWRMAPASRWRTLFLTLGVMSIVATLSRSVLLAAGMVTLVVLVQERGVRLTHRQAMAGLTATAALVLFLLLQPWALQAAGVVLEPLGERFSVREGSASVHLALIDRGLEIGTSSVRNALVGIGFGNSFVVLEEFFAGSKYGNFHSLYVTLLAESGVFALLLGLVLLLVPVLRGGLYQPLVAGFIFFNLFYQSHTEPIFWLVLALAWMRIEPAGAWGERVAVHGPAAQIRTPARRLLLER